jgi:hypothetical protein
MATRKGLEPSEGRRNLKMSFAVDLLQVQRLLITDTTVHCGPQPPTPAGKAIRCHRKGIAFGPIRGGDKVLRVEMSGLHLNPRRRLPLPAR